MASLAAIAPENNSPAPTITNPDTTKENPNPQSYTNAINSIPTTPKKFGDSSVKARVLSLNGVPAIIFKAKFFYEVMATECKFTIVGRFLKPRPQIDRLRATFEEKTPLKGTVIIGVYDNYNVFMDFTNEEDFAIIWPKRVMTIEGMQMWMTKWSPKWRPEIDSPIILVWVLLPQLPFHCHTWYYVRQTLSPIDTPIAMDNATNGRTRPSMAKVRVEIDLTKPRINKLWIGAEDENCPLRGFYQKIEYEAMPKYCTHCCLLGHAIEDCRVLERKKRQEKDNKNTGKGKEDKNRNLEDSMEKHEEDDNSKGIESKDQQKDDKNQKENNKK
ncbi:uncharacterized protein LOC132047566 [Lycium ferocissimum]|uniref:uncharacterized protein LOC132047566 n=1 Tax=Lycium ferocissimum TaxID=112874 RepID=UPI0028158781|nr:uncharacterized protein LOC132047566 [Lycium ferocissimum]